MSLPFWISKKIGNWLFDLEQWRLRKYGDPFKKSLKDYLKHQYPPVGSERFWDSLYFWVHHNSDPYYRSGFQFLYWLEKSKRDARTN